MMNSLCTSPRYTEVKGSVQPSSPSFEYLYNGQSWRSSQAILARAPLSDANGLHGLLAEYKQEIDDKGKTQPKVTFTPST